MFDLESESFAFSKARLMPANGEVRHTLSSSRLSGRCRGMMGICKCPEGDGYFVPPQQRFRVRPSYDGFEKILNRCSCRDGTARPSRGRCDWIQCPSRRWLSVRRGVSLHAFRKTVCCLHLLLRCGFWNKFTGCRADRVKYSSGVASGRDCAPTLLRFVVARQSVSADGILAIGVLASTG